MNPVRHRQPRAVVVTAIATLLFVPVIAAAQFAPPRTTSALQGRSMGAVQPAARALQAGPIAPAPDAASALSADSILLMEQQKLASMDQRIAQQMNGQARSAHGADGGMQSGAEVTLIQLQSLISQRQQQIALVNHLLQGRQQADGAIDGVGSHGASVPCPSCIRAARSRP